MTEGTDQGPESAGAQGEGLSEREALAQEMGDELTEVFLDFVRGDLSFAELTFLTYGALEDLHAIESGDYVLTDDDEDEDGDDPDGGYDIVEATAEQEDLAQEPSREAR
jgi:hypothetical protein